MTQLFQEPVEACSRLLAARKKTIAFAESATAGALMAAFALTEDSGTILKGGIVCYDMTIKTDLLGVPRGLIDTYSAESIPVTKAITNGLKAIIDADYYIGVTGLIKPGGSESPKKPVGTIFTCLLIEGDYLENKAVFQGDEIQVMEQVTEHICMLIIEKLSDQRL